MPPKQFAAFTIGLSLCAHALVIDQTELDKQLANASLVADITILDVEALSDRDYHAVRWSKARLDRILQFHDDGFSIPDEGDEILVETPGGEIQGMGTLYSGFARPFNHQRYRARLYRASNDKFFVSGFEFGLKPLKAQRAYSRNRTDGSNGQGNGSFLYWDSHFFPIPYFISAPSFVDNAQYIPSIDAAFHTWSEPSDVKVEFLAMGCSNTTRHENDGMNNVILLKDFWPYDPAAVAITRNFYVASSGDQSGMILDSDILLNGVYHNFSATGAAGKHDVQNIVTHEAGHFLGLGHEISPEDTDATMYGSAETGEVKKRSLEADDLAGIHEAYTGSANRTGALGNHCQMIDQPHGCAAVHFEKPSLTDKLGMLWPLVLLFPIFIARRTSVRLENRQH